MMFWDPHHKEKTVMFSKIVNDIAKREHTDIIVVKIYIHYCFEVTEQSYFGLKELI